MAKLSFFMSLALLLIFAQVSYGCVTLYKNNMYRGSQKTICTNGNVPANWNDQTSSIYVSKGYIAYLYKDYSFGGQSLKINSGYWNAPRNWNDQLSSIIILKANSPTFFYDYDLKGKSFVKVSSGDLTSAQNDQVSSIFVPAGYYVTLFSDFGYGGDFVTLAPGVWQAPAGWNDQASSVLITKQNTPLFFGDYNLQGTAFALSKSGDLQASRNDQVSSIFVPQGYLVQLYKDYGNQGDSITLYPGVWQAPSDWNDNLSSVVIVKDCLLLFADYDLQGASFTMCKSGDVPAEWNDQVSSIAVLNGLSVKAFSDYSYGGNAIDISAGTWNAPADGWNDQISSLQITKA